MSERPRPAWRVLAFDPTNDHLRDQAARMLVDEFADSWPDAWPTLQKAEEEVSRILAPGHATLAAVCTEPEELLGWVSAQPQYDGRVWELHPLVVGAAHQGRGIGRALVLRLEAEVAGRGGLTLWLGTDDEANLTSLGGVDLYPNVLEKLTGVEADARHPLGFYLTLGFEVVGVMPDANGFGKPDIFMAKRVGR